MTAAQKKGLWIGGIIVVAAAIAGGVAYAAHQTTPAPLPPAPNAGQLTLNVSAGANAGQVASGQKLWLALPSGNAWTAMTLNGNPLTVVGMSNLFMVTAGSGGNVPVGANVLAGTFNDANGHAQVATIALNVTA